MTVAATETNIKVVHDNAFVCAVTISCSCMNCVYTISIPMWLYVLVWDGAVAITAEWVGASGTAAAGVLLGE